MDQKEYQKLFRQIGESTEEAQRVNKMPDEEFKDLLEIYSNMLKMENFRNTHRVFHRIVDVQEDLWLNCKNYSRAEILGNYLLEFIEENKKDIALASVDVLDVYSNCCTCAIELQQTDLYQKYREGLCLVQYEIDNYCAELDLGGGMKVTKYIGETLSEEERERRVNVMSEKAHKENSRCLKQRKNIFSNIVDYFRLKRAIRITQTK